MEIPFLEDLEVFSFDEHWFLIVSKNRKKQFLFNSRSREIAAFPTNSLKLTRQFLVEKAIPAQSKLPSPLVDLEIGAVPRLMLLLTQRCNLKCVYCHCNSGEGQSEAMTEEVARAAIIEYLRITEREGDPKRRITFMGGGNRCWSSTL